MENNNKTYSGKKEGGGRSKKKIGWDQKPSLDSRKKGEKRGEKKLSNFLINENGQTGHATQTRKGKKKAGHRLKKKTLGGQMSGEIGRLIKKRKERGNGGETTGGREDGGLTWKTELEKNKQEPRGSGMTDRKKKMPGGGGDGIAGFFEKTTIGGGRAQIHSSSKLKCCRKKKTSWLIRIAEKCRLRFHRKDHKTGCRI